MKDVKYAFLPLEYKPLFVRHSKSQEQSAQDSVTTPGRIFCTKVLDICQDRRPGLARRILKWNAKSALFLIGPASTFVLDHAHKAAY
jgi:hypothetical protein